MSNIKLNIIANYAGSIWSALMGLAFVPLYIKFMGIESYGLVGFFSTLISLFSVLDLGLGTTINREMARRHGIVAQEQSARDLLRTVEIIYWLVAIVIGATIVCLSYPIARYWIRPEKLAINDVQQAVMIMGLVTVLRWPFGLYQGGLMGLQKQVLVNAIAICYGTFRGLGAVFVLWLISPTIQAFFCWQIIVSGLETFTMGLVLWILLPHTPKPPKFQKTIVLELWRFAGGMAGISFVALILSNTDKIILSKMLSLEQFGYYMLAWTVVSSLNRLVQPIVSASFPRFSQLIAMCDIAGLRAFYHKSCQLMSVTAFPLALVLSFFSYEVLFLWTSDPYIADSTYLVLRLLIIGTACNVMLTLNFRVQYAYGLTVLAFGFDAASVIIVIPLLILLVSNYGTIGGAIAWAGFNIGYMLIALPVMHRWVLQGELGTWYLYDVGLPFVAAFIPVLIGRLLFNEQYSKLWTVMCLGLITCLSFVLAAIMAKEMRPSVENLISKSLAKVSLDHTKIFG